MRATCRSQNDVFMSIGGSKRLTRHLTYVQTTSSLIRVPTSNAETFDANVGHQQHLKYLSQV